MRIFGLGGFVPTKALLGMPTLALSGNSMRVCFDLDFDLFSTANRKIGIFASVLPQWLVRH